VLHAGDSHAPQSAVALEKLCGAYWHPLYAFVRGRGFDPEEARDLTQEFFARLLEKKWLKQADPARGAGPPFRQMANYWPIRLDGIRKFICCIFMKQVHQLPSAVTPLEPRPLLFLQTVECWQAAGAT